MVDLDILREEIFTDYIQEYHYLTNDEISEMVDEKIKELIK